MPTMRVSRSSLDLSICFVGGGYWRRPEVDEIFVFQSATKCTREDTGWIHPGIYQRMSIQGSRSRCSYNTSLRTRS